MRQTPSGVRPGAHARHMQLEPLSRRKRSDIFLAAPPEDDGDFTQEDPLALDYVSQQVGLLLWPRLTTRTSRAQSYAVVAYGLASALAATEHYGLMPTDAEL